MLAVVAEAEEEGLCHLEACCGVAPLSSTDSGRGIWDGVLPQILTRTVRSGIAAAGSSNVRVRVLVRTGVSELAATVSR